MSIRNLVSKVANPERVPARSGRHTDPFLSLQKEMNSLFDSFFRDFRNLGLMPAAAVGEADPGYTPRVNVSETDTEIRVSAELPGLDEKSVTVELDEGALTLKGEKREETSDKGRNWYRREYSYGSFHRVVPLPCRVRTEQARASFKKGLLTVTLPKHEQDRAQRKRIPIEAG